MDYIHKKSLRDFLILYLNDASSIVLDYINFYFFYLIESEREQAKRVHPPLSKDLRNKRMSSFSSSR